MRDESLGQSRDGNNVAGESLIDGGTLQAAEGQHLGDAADFDQTAVVVEHLDVLIWFHAAGKYPAGDDAAQIGVGLQDGTQHPERAVLNLGWRDVADDKVEQRRHALVLRALGARSHPALLGRAVEDWEIELLLGGVERGEQVEHRIGHFARPRVGPVNLIDHHNGL